MPELKESLMGACGRMPAHTQELCLMDTGIGDGDHGLTAERGFLAAQKALEAYTGTEDAGLFSAMGEAMARSMGGAIGPLYGAYWRSFSKALNDESLTGENLGFALGAGCDQVMRLGRAVLGDKTVVDAMYPCTLAASNGQGDLAARLALAAEGAKAGAQATKEMTAKKGRARFLGGQSVGHVDAGAYSFALFMGHWAEQISQAKEA